MVGLFLLVASPAEAQKREKRDQYEITAEELKEYGQATLAEAVPRARPSFFSLPGASRGEQVISGVSPQVIVYVRTQSHGDTTTLRYYKARDVERVRLFKPGDSRSPHTAGNAYVIQVIPKDPSKVPSKDPSSP
jgi:hypothetical protein